MYNHFYKFITFFEELFPTDFLPNVNLLTILTATNSFFALASNASISCFDFSLILSDLPMEKVWENDPSWGFEGRFWESDWDFFKVLFRLLLEAVFGWGLRAERGLFFWGFGDSFLFVCGDWGLCFGVWMEDRNGSLIDWESGGFWEICEVNCQLYLNLDIKLRLSHWGILAWDYMQPDLTSLDWRRTRQF